MSQMSPVLCVCVCLVRWASTCLAGGGGVSEEGGMEERKDLENWVVGVIRIHKEMRWVFGWREAGSQNGAFSCAGSDSFGEWALSPLALPPTTLYLMFPTLSSNDLKVGEFLMSPSFLLMAVPTVERAAEVFCPAWDSVSWVFLYTSELVMSSRVEEAERYLQTNRVMHSHLHSNNHNVLEAHTALWNDDNWLWCLTSRMQVLVNKTASKATQVSLKSFLDAQTPGV